MLYIHIGPHKTGTTTIQTWLCANRSILPSFGYIYPGTRLNHNYLKKGIRKGGPGGEAPASLAELLREIEQGHESSPRCSGILSAESLEHLDEAGIRSLKHWLGEHSATIVVYLRPAWDRRASVVAEHLKHLVFNRRVYRNLAVQNGNAPVLQASSLTGQDLLERWEAVFGLENMRVRPLHRALLRHGSLIEDFLHTVGLPSEQSCKDYVRVAPQNEMADANTLRVQRALVDYVQPETWPRPVGRKVGNLVLRAGAKTAWDHGRPNLITATAAVRWQAELAASYAAIANRYGLRQASPTVFPAFDFAQLPRAGFDWSISNITPESLLQLLVHCLIDVFGPSRQKGNRPAAAALRTGRRRQRYGRRTAAAVVLTQQQNRLLETILTLARLESYPMLTEDSALDSRVRACIRAAVGARPDVPAGTGAAGRSKPLELNSLLAFTVLAESLILATGGRRSWTRPNIEAAT